MSWKKYQNDVLGSSKNSLKGKNSHVHFLIGGAGFALFLVLLFGVPWFKAKDRVEVVPEHNKSAAASLSKTEEKNPKLKLKGLIDASVMLANSDEIRLKQGDEDVTAELTVDTGLQRFLTSKLAKYKVDWSGVAVMDPKSGEVLSLAYHSEKEPESENLALRATFPAASVFKIITAAAALEEAGYRRDSTVSFGGSMYGINKRQILRDSGQSGLTLTKAFAKSANIVFGKLGAHDVTANLLKEYSSRFGFNNPIPFELPIATSTAEIPTDDVVQQARTAAGFGNVTLSPLHGAMLAGAILNEGQMMEPFIIKKLSDSSGKVTYASAPRVWRQAIGAVTAREMRRMMASTVEEGTAHRSFRKFEQHPILNKLQMGGKTGSLSGKNPRGRNEWFVGYARSQDRQIAVGIVIVNDKVWRLKPSELMKEIFEYYFAPRPVLEANAQTGKLQGP